MLQLFSHSEFQKRVLFQLASLTKEVQDLRGIIERQSVANSYGSVAAARSVQLPAVQKAPIETVTDYVELLARCEEESCQQSLVCAILQN